MKRKLAVAVVLCAVLIGVSALTGCGGSSAEGFDSSQNISVMSREDGSGTRGAFIELFGIEQEQNGEKVDMTTVDAGITNNTQVMLSSVANDDYSIGYVSLGSLNDTVKAVKINGVEATTENVSNGSYEIARPFNIVTKDLAGDSVNEVAKDFISYIMSSDGQAIVEANGYIKVSENGPYQGSSPSGKVTVGGSSSVTPVMEKLAEAYQAVNTNATVEIQGTDSTTGITSAAEGAYDIGMASRELKEEETSQGLVSQVIAMDGIAVVVNQNNTVDDLTAEQVRKIYTGETTVWEDVAK